MAAIRGKDTKPELALRASLRSAGATGYRLHRKDLPGCPDVAFLRWRVAVFVDGAFWHGHPEKWHPENASEFWRKKITSNMERDRRVDLLLRQQDWSVVRIWDTELQSDQSAAVDRVLQQLRARGWVGPIG